MIRRLLIGSTLEGPLTRIQSIIVSRIALCSSESDPRRQNKKKSIQQTPPKTIGWTQPLSCHPRTIDHRGRQFYCGRHRRRPWFFPEELTVSLSGLGPISLSDFVLSSSAISFSASSASFLLGESRRRVARHLLLVSSRMHARNHIPNFIILDTLCSGEREASDAPFLSS